MKSLITNNALRSLISGSGSILTILLLFCSSQAHTNSLANKIDSVIKPYVSHDVFNGVVLVAKNGKVVYQQGHGLANREWKTQNSPQVNQDGNLCEVCKRTHAAKHLVKILPPDQAKKEIKGI